MKELELKFLEIDKAKLIGMLEARGARLTTDSILKTLYFDDKDASIQRANELLRIRTFGDKVELCRKTNMRMENGCKVYDEIETHVSDFDATRTILESLGYSATISYEKRRIEYVLEDGSKFEIDEIPSIPPFVEIEAISSERIEELAKEFNLNEYERSPLTGEELLETKYNTQLNGKHF